MGFDPKNMAAFLIFVCILSGLTGWAVIELLIWIGRISELRGQHERRKFRILAARFRRA